MKKIGPIILIAVIIVLTGGASIVQHIRLKAVETSRTDSDVIPAQRSADPTSDLAALQARLEDSFGQLPLLFVENQGQWDEQVGYAIQGSDKTLYFTPGGVTFALTAPLTGEDEGGEAEFGDPQTSRTKIGKPSSQRRWAVKLDFVGANPDVGPKGLEKDEAVISYFKGRPEEWQTGLPTYRRLVYYDLWPGINLVYEGTVNRLKYHFVVQPGADPDQIRLAYRGATGVHLETDGALVVETPLGSFQDDAPLAYQEFGDDRIPVAMSYVLEAAGPQTRRYHFELGPYDPSLPLFLDPAVLVFAGFIGGSSEDNGYGIVVDGSGSAYVTGETYSSEATFPVTAGPDLTYNGGWDAFVAKVNPSGTGLVYAGYIGGSDDEYGRGIAVDGSGSAYITGETYSSEATFPVTAGPDLTNNGSSDAFVAKVNPSGAGLVYAGYIGGSGSDEGYGIAVDGSGSAYITGYTTSSEATFPVTAGPDLTHNGDNDAFVVKVNPSGAGLVYAGYIGGSSSELGRGIAVDGSGSAYLTGYTNSSEATFPVTAGPDLTYNGRGDAFAAKVNPSGAGLVYAGYIGGSSWDEGYGIAVDGSGSAYVTGYTTSDETTFPVTAGPDLTHNGDRDAFVAKVIIPVPPANLELFGPDSGMIDTKYHFTATTAPISTTVPVTYVWQATGQSLVTHTGGLTDTAPFKWEVSGLKHITVTASNDFGAITNNHQITLYRPVQAGFVGDPNSGTAPLEVTFTNRSTGDYDAYAWDFGDGGSSNDCEPDDYVYRIPGVYTVTLTVTGPGGTDTMTREEYIEVQNNTLYLPVVMKP